MHKPAAIKTVLVPIDLHGCVATASMLIRLHCCRNPVQRHMEYIPHVGMLFSGSATAGLGH